MNIEIFYIAYDGIITQSVFDSQVIGFLRKISGNKKIKINFIGFENLKIYIFKNKYLRDKKKILCDLGMEVFFYPRVPGLTGIYLNILLILIRFYLSLFIKKNKIVFHTRGNKSALIACKIKRILPFLKIIYDSRGVESEEYLYSKRLSKKKNSYLSSREMNIFHKLKGIEEYVVKNSDKVFAVSNELRKYYLKKYRISKDKIYVIPCCIDKSVFYFDEKIRKRVRDNYNLNDKLVLVYCGSMHLLQKPEIILKFFKEVYKLDKKVFLLILTHNLERAEKFIQAENIFMESCKVLSLDHNKIPPLLNASDIGIIFREKNLVNRVASPTKFAEYISCGLYTVLTDGIGDISDMIVKKNIGEVVKSLKDSDIELLANRILLKRKMIQSYEYKNKIYNLACQEYDWDNYITNILLIYKNLSS